MEVILQERVEEIRQEVAGFSPARGKKEMAALGQRQPELLNFMMEFTQDLKEEVRELAIYMFFVVCRFFEKASAKKIKKISFQQITKSFESNEEFLERLEGTHEKFLERIAGTQILAQPSVIKYVVETLIEGPEEGDPVELTDDDIGYLFLLFKTVIDLLDRAG
jgi:hypothetical protein